MVQFTTQRYKGKEVDMKEKIKKELAFIANSSDKKTVLTIIWVTLIITLYFYFGIQDFFENAFSGYLNSQNEIVYYKYIYHNFMAFFFFFVLSIPFVKFVLKQKLIDTGLRFKEKKLSLNIMLLALIITPLLSLSALTDTGMTTMYPLGGALIYKNAAYFLLYYLSYVAYYFGWEYLFRGLALFKISDKYGAALAIAVTTMVSALIHSSIAGFGKPFTETFSAIMGGLVLGYIALKTRSIYTSLFIHFLLGFSLDLLIRLIA